MTLLIRRILFVLFVVPMCAVVSFAFVLMFPIFSLIGFIGDADPVPLEWRDAVAEPWLTIRNDFPQP